jgi:anthraniloyl-CoA monooxygenase
MRIACLGGGPAGLYFAILMKVQNPAHDIAVIERNKPYDTFGWGVVLSAETLAHLEAADAESASSIRQHFAYWDDIAVVFQGQTQRSSGHGFSGIGRKRLLMILQDRARALGITQLFETEFDTTANYKDYDLVIACDGVNSKVRTEFAATFKPDIDVRACKYIWLGTKQTFADAFTFIFEETEHGWIWVHAYQFEPETATFIIECSDATWRASGFDAMDQAETLATLERIFARHLGGNALMSNARHLRGSAWLNFNRVLCERWIHGNVVLMGDAAATAHFSVGSGTKLALESAIALAKHLKSETDIPAALAAYETERRLEVLKLQNAARNSTEWFEHVERYLHLDPVQFNYSLLTRSQRISHENLRARDPKWLASAEKWFDQRTTGHTPPHPRAPMFTPFKLGTLELTNRVVVSPTAQYRAVNGTPGDWHFVHYAERAKGGAGLVLTEMTCVSPDARITPGCTGLYTDAHTAAWRRIIDFVHDETAAKIGLQLGHAGAKGSTQVGWEAMDAPLHTGNWPLLAPSAHPWSTHNQIPKAMTRVDMDLVRNQFVAATRRAAEAGFDVLELHCAHGYLLSAFLTPISNTRTDDYGGSATNRLRYPLEVFTAVRAAWPSDKPLSVRISAHDWVGTEGIQPADAVLIAQAFTDAGAAIIDVSAGQTTPRARPVYGRMFQTPFSDQIRNEARVATMAVGNITEPDHINSILMAGRADLVCLARPHLANPYWTLHAAAQAGYNGVIWPRPYEAGRDQLTRLTARPETAPGKV